MPFLRQSFNQFLYCLINVKSKSLVTRQLYLYGFLTWSKCGRIKCNRRVGVSPGKIHNSLDQTGRERLHPTVVFKKTKNHQRRGSGPMGRGGLPGGRGSGDGPLRPTAPRAGAARQVRTAQRRGRRGGTGCGVGAPFRRKRPRA